ncbi:MAG: excinuclease ABC subunit C [Candidatus Thermofonsia Clade 1 bacterium]|jgi:excinuclease ABC subunit C|uniref:UvrABC system protein C n=1 Tax=Candidatus Thermofonsia Clade 1 bacterium TaxID=2364210 RepID=A0A2M8PG86_9CHLR|nr:MAG: excinuclease ABC subunit C [Candidatus Thermofonsia Clade 1 bacterium]
MSFVVPEHLQAILKNLPHKPGCYLMKDAEGTIIYIGKAVDLHNRVRSYFDSSVTDPKTLRLREEIAHIDFIVLPNEIAALHTEYHLIREHQPRYNVRFKDDKKYPYIAVRWAQDFPRVEITRRLEQDGSRYFGPYTSAWSVRETLDVLRRAFPYLTCDRAITGKDERACLYYDIKLCNAPCIGKVSREEYRANLQGLMDFLSGQSDAIIRQVREEMNAAAAALQFERAAALRDRLKAMERIVERQKVVLSAHVNQDVIAFAQEKNDTCVQVLFIRGGRLIGREHFLLDGAAETDAAEILRQFVLQFYENAAQVPEEVLLPEEAAEAKLLEEWLRSKRGKKVALSVPRRGSKAELVRIALENAQETLAMLRAQWASDTNKQTEALAELQSALNLPAPPNRIECFDVSTLQGTATVASRVVFVQGVPRKAEYRKFNIKSVSTIGEPNDFQAMREALTRRFQRYADAISGALSTTPIGKKGQEDTWRLLPDLLIVDGGKGQLNVALEVLQQFHLADQVPVCALAKREEELFVPTQAHSILLPRRSQALYLVQRVRDEAHRFAITANRQQRTKRGVVSRLESIHGIGAAKRKALLEAFDRDIEKIRAASIEELMQVKGITRQLAERIKASL